MTRFSTASESSDAGDERLEARRRLAFLALVELREGLEELEHAFAAEIVRDGEERDVVLGERERLAGPVAAVMGREQPAGVDAVRAPPARGGPRSP